MIEFNLTTVKGWGEMFDFYTEDDLEDMNWYDFPILDSVDEVAAAMELWVDSEDGTREAIVLANIILGNRQLLQEYLNSRGA